MKIIVVLLLVVAAVSANCGCLKCNRNLKVVSGPSCPVTIIYRDEAPHHCPQPLPYNVQIPIVKPEICPLPGKPRSYKIELPEEEEIYEEEPCEHSYSVQTPVLPPPACVSIPLSLKYCTDRVVLPAPIRVCPQERCQQQQQQQTVKYIIEPVKDCRINPSSIDVLPPTRRCNCNCRYNSRRKRDIPLINHGVNFMVGLLPPFIKLPIQQTVNMMKLNQNKVKAKHTVNNLKKSVAKQNRSIQHAMKTNRNIPRATNTNKNRPRQMTNSKQPNILDKLLDLNLQPTKIVKDSDLNKASYDFMKNLNEEEEKRQKLLQNFLPANIEQSNKKIKLPMTLKEKAVLMEKLHKLRSKRSIIIGSDELSLPFFEVKDEDFDNHINEDEEEEQEEDEGGEDYSSEDSEEEIIYLPRRLSKRLDLKSKYEEKREDMENKILQRHPLLYLIKAPVTLMKQFHEIKQTVDPVLKQGAELLGSSKQYFKDFHKNFESGILNLASNVIGDFDHPGPRSRNPFDQILRPARRFRRSVEEPYQPEYENAFNTQKTENFQLVPQEKVRKKRYILKVVDESEVQEFLKEKLGDLIDGKSEKPKKSRKSKINDEAILKSILNDSRKSRKDPIVGQQQGNKKVTVEKLKPKIIIDNNGIPFMEMNGVKRPMALKLRHRKKPESEEIVGEEEQEPEVQSEENEKTGDKLSDLIELAKEKVENGEPVIKSKHTEMPIHTIKEKITQTLNEVENLVNMEFRRYSDIHDDLLQAQIIKTSIVEDWKKILMERKINDISYKLGLLDKFKELQDVKDNCVQEIAKMLPEENSFMTKTLIIVMIRLQKLQCLISRVVDDFSERIKLNREFNVQKEIQYVDLLSSINLVYGMTRNDNLNAVKKAKDQALQEEMTLLENLRKLLLIRDMNLINEEASIIWEMKNIEKLQKDTIEEMNSRIDSGLKIKKELKIIFDLQKQWEQCNTQQKTLLLRINNNKVTFSDMPVADYNRMDKKDLKKVWLDKYRVYLENNMKKQLKPYEKWDNA